MSRIYGRAAGVIDVRCAGGSGAPEQFIWRERLYRVNQVLQRWDRSSAWWKDIRTKPTGCDVQTWRVEASAGRSAAEGVYELSFDPGTGQWYLLRTVD
ncbi:MAG: DUF6504 family protein [Candidatus Nanopelagicales bacterium]